MPQKILVVDDESAIRTSLNEILTMEGFEITVAVDGADAMKKLKASEYNCVLCDIKMPKVDGLEVLDFARVNFPDTPVVMISGHGTIETAVDAVKKGAFDFIAKPLDLNRLLITIRNAMDKGSLVEETTELRKRLVRASGVEMIGSSPQILLIKETLKKVAPTDARVLITGENGVGKELVARSLHMMSSRAKGPLIEVNCAAIPPELIESELFGHEKGAFTSAIKQRAGKFEQAHGGTLFLDEIGDMSLSAQAKVLRVLQESKLSRVGGDGEISVDVRVIAATNKDLVKETKENTFRLDLYHRLSVIRIHVPSLNDRRDDIPTLIQHFIAEISKGYAQPKKEISAEAMDLLKKHNWTGNIRELRNAVERLIILSGKKIQKQDVEAYVIID